MNRILTILLLLFLALLCYFLGFNTGAGLFFLAGIVFEAGFWLNIFRKSQSRDKLR